MSEGSLGRIVEMWTAQNSYHGVGMVVAYQEQPTFVIRTPDGKQTSWAAHLCREPGLSKEAGDELMNEAHAVAVGSVVCAWLASRYRHPEKAPPASKSQEGKAE